MGATVRSVPLPTRRDGDNPLGFPIIAGKFTPSLCFALCVAVLVGGACSGDDDGEPVVDLGQSAVGTCLQFGTEIGETVERLPAVPCDEQHSHEIIAVADSAAKTYPGFEALEAEAQAVCLGAFEDYVGISAFDSELFFSWLLPTLDSWDRRNDREIVCVVGEGNGAPLTGSVRNLGR